MSIIGKLSGKFGSKKVQASPSVGSKNEHDLVVSHGNNSSLAESLLIPEPTKSLLWITDADTSLIESATSIRIVVSSSGAHQQENGFYAEPSLIWKKLPIEQNSELVQEAMYWPSYSAFSPKARYQYLRWLQDITQPTNLSFVFLYFYGLERHLLVGDYDAAVDEIVRLLKYHPKKSFVQYASRSLVVASLAKDRLDVLDRIPSLLSEEIDETLAMRIMKGTTMTPDDIIDISSRVGFKNKRYIKLYLDVFRLELQRQIDDYERQFGKLLGTFKLSDFSRAQSDVFANQSIPDRIRHVQVPVILDDARFSKGIYNLLHAAHEGVKTRLAKGEVVRTTVKKPSTSTPPVNTHPVSSKEVDKLLEQIERKTSRILDIHFELQQYIEENYRKRSDAKSYHNSIVGCLAQIKIQDLAAKQFIVEFHDSTLPMHVGYKQLAVILEKEGKITEAINIAKKAQSNGWNGDWESRILRLTKKAQSR